LSTLLLLKLMKTYLRLHVHDVYLIQVAHLKACGDKTKLEKYYLVTVR